MASTGITVAEEIKSEYEGMKLKRIKHKFIIYKIGADGKQIVTDLLGPADASFSEFAAHLPATEGRYAIYDADFTTKDGRPGNKLVFISWVPDNSTAKQRMIYAGSKDALTNVLTGIMVKINATDFSELTAEIIEEKCKQFN